MSKRAASSLDADESAGRGPAFQAITDPTAAVPSSASKRNRVALACVICRQRKIKCSGQKPCKTCVDAKRPSRCEYQSATPLRDDEYVRSLEERLRQLSSQVGREASQPAQPEEPNAANLLSASSYTFDVELPSVLEDSRQPSTSAAMIPSPPFTAASQEAPPNISRSTSVQNRNAPQPSQEFELAGVSASEGQYVTTLASPSVSNRHLESGDSSARTLLHSVEAALQQLPHRQGLQSHQYNQSSLPTSPKLKPLQLPFVWQQSKAELYTLPQRHISDALVNVYRALNYPIFKVLHWPTFMLKYESTFTAGKQADPIWLGILNQIYAIACQIGGRDIVGDDEFEAGHTFHQRALALGYPVALCTENLQGLQYLLLMGQYLLSTSQPTLCRNVVGHAVRSAQAQGLNMQRDVPGASAVQIEMRRRSWAGVIVLDATSSAVLGLPPLLTPDGLPNVLLSGAEDDEIEVEEQISPVISSTSSSLFMRETTRLLSIQIQVLATLYKSDSDSTFRWPDVASILASARELDSWQAALPLALHTSDAGTTARAGVGELELQAHVIHARFLNLKLLIHRPMLFHICQRASTNDLLGDAPSHLDADIAKASMSHCCAAALALAEHVTGSWERGSRVGGAWWFHLYYFHSACLVILAGLIIEVIASAKSISCLPDVERAIKAVKSAEIYLSTQPGDSRSILPRLPKGPARSTARSCRRIITGLTSHVLASAPHLQSPTPFPELQDLRDGPSEAGTGSGPRQINQQTSALQSISDTEGLYQAFLDLFPDVPTLPNYENGQLQSGHGLVNPATLQHSDIASSFALQQQYLDPSLTSSWSIGDLLRAGSAPQ